MLGEKDGVPLNQMGSVRLDFWTPEVRSQEALGPADSSKGRQGLRWEEKMEGRNWGNKNSVLFYVSGRRSNNKI